ncbi:MAG TPA: molybdopterin molybdenumtransferase MoeA [Phaeodactylibacter sp.]|nr:molybdopterin molybdenumtransferase MoeA [Phaeodactylibacter sp.]
MITIEEAQRIISQTIQDFGTEKVSLNYATQRVLRENLFADRDFPPYNRVTMDGIAIQGKSFQNGNRKFPIEDIAPAGAAQKTLQNANHCIEVMTGSILPNNTDTVIRYEDLDIQDGVATIQLNELKTGKNVHRKGEDRLQNSKITSLGKIISPAEIGVAATIGKSHLKVSRLPKIILISTGDELVEVTETPLPHQIRKSNIYHLKSTLAQHGIAADSAHLDDDMAKILVDLKRILEDYEVIIMSGGVSKGKFDFLPEALKTLGVTKLFHKVMQRPGKPFWFGKAPSGATIFALPGNPVSSFMCTQVHFLPWLRSCLQLPTPTYPTAILQRDTTFKPDLVYFLQVKISCNEQGQILAMPVDGNGSGDLANLVDADAFLRIPRGKTVFEKGECFPVIFYRNVF